MGKQEGVDELFEGRHFDREVIILCVRWYLQFKLSLRDLAEMMAERGLSLAHTGSVANLCPVPCRTYDPGRFGSGSPTGIDFKSSHFEREIVLWGVRWYVAYPISDRQLEEMMEERGVEVDHSTLSRWVLKYVPLLEQAFRMRKRRVGGSWRMDETDVRTRGQWKYLYRAIDKAGNTVDFLLTAKRDRKAALRFLCKATGQHGTLAKITIDQSGANTAAIESYNAAHDTEVEIRQVKYPQQCCRTGPSSDRASIATDDGVQVLRVGRSDPCWHSAHAHDPQRPADGRGTPASGEPVLFGGQLTFMLATALLRRDPGFATEPLIRLAATMAP